MIGIDDREGSGTYYVGIDAGSVSINAVVVSREKEITYEYPYKRHFGGVEKEVELIIDDLYTKLGKNKIASLAFTGNHGQELKESYGGIYEFETITQVLGCLFLRPELRTIISMGGQETALFQVSHASDGWELEYFNTNGPCASGTGSFIDQQALRLATSIYDADVEISQHQIDGILRDFVRLGLRSKEPASVACRCTVFTKSDMIHLQNKGERLEDIIWGLHVGNARNYMSTIVINRVLEEPILFVGGLSLNELQVRAFRCYFPHLIVPKYNTSVGALGVALRALQEGGERDGDRSLFSVVQRAISTDLPLAPRLLLKRTAFPQNNFIPKRTLRNGTALSLGIDIGSTTTKYALINEDREIVHKSYVHTQGKPIEVTQRLLKTIQDEVDDRIKIVGTATTGSGRNVVGDFLNADLVIDEITAHARGAVAIDPDIDTIFEIGGQDSKYIHISNTHPLDFDMNKVCAAGTGSFLHELANKYGINIVEEFQEIALSSDRPVKLAERCTVFMESDLISYHQKGLPERDLMAGLCYAIVHNYLNRVVGKRRIGQRIMFLGGPSLNKAVVAAFENVLGQGLVVPNHREVLGAFGAAISVQEEMSLGKGQRSRFRGLRSAVQDRMDYAEKVCQADSSCQNQCKLKIYDFGGRRSIWGGECGRYDVIRGGDRRAENLFQLRERIWLRYMSGLYEELRSEPLMEIDQRPTVGMQRSLYAHQTDVLWACFFDQLGYRLVLTPRTNTQICADGIEMMTAETCFPLKVSHGHVRKLMAQTRFLFLPTIIDMPTPVASETGFYCPLVQSNTYMVSAALNLDRDSVLAPIIHLKNDASSLAVELADQLSHRLKTSRSRIKRALQYALSMQQMFAREIHERGAEVIDKHNPEKPLVIITGRSYNLYDDRLNLRLGQNLAKIGVDAVPMDFVDVSSVDLSDFPSMYWGLGAQILRTGRLIKSVPNWFGMHLTNFSCGADSFLEHFYRHIMGDKPYLILELDEHSGVAGVMTRLEAFKNVIENTMRKQTAIALDNTDPARRLDRTRSQSK